jgi:hypothetical protein
MGRCSGRGFALGVKEKGDWLRAAASARSAATRVSRADPYLCGDRGACHYRATEWRHKEIELAAHDLLQLLDRSSA